MHTYIPTDRDRDEGLTGRGNDPLVAVQVGPSRMAVFEVPERDDRGRPVTVSVEKPVVDLYVFPNGDGGPRYRPRVVISDDGEPGTVFGPIRPDDPTLTEDVD